MFSYKTSVNLIANQYLSTNPSPLRGVHKRNSKSKPCLNYSPIQISIIKPKEKKHSISMSNFISSSLKYPEKLKHRGPLPPLKRKIRIKTDIQVKNFKLSQDLASNKPSVLLTIKQFKSQIEQKYANFYNELALGTKKSIEIHDILNFIRVKKIKNELGLAPWENESESINQEGILAKIILETFDIDCKNSFSLENFLSACSVYEIYFSQTPFNFFGMSKLKKLYMKIKVLKGNFLRYTEKETISTEYLLNLVTQFSVLHDRRSFFSYIKSSKLDFSMYLRVLPIFLSLEASKL